MTTRVAGSYVERSPISPDASSVSIPQRGGNPHISDRAPSGSVSSRIDAILVKIRDFFQERFLELRINIKAVVSLPSICPAAIKRNMESISEFAESLGACESDERAQKEQLLRAFTNLSEHVRGSFVSLSEASLQEFINETDPQKAERMKEKFEKECSYIQQVQRVLLPIRAIFHRANRSNNNDGSSTDPTDCGANRSSSTERPRSTIEQTDPLLFARPDRIVYAADEPEELSLRRLSPAQRQRGSEIAAMGALIPDDFRGEGSTPLKDQFQCNLMQSGDPMQIPVFHDISQPQRYDGLGFEIIPAVEGRQDLQNMQQVLDSSHRQCSLCREPVDRNTIKIDVTLQKMIALRLATAITMVSDADIIAQLKKLETDFSRNAEGRRVSERRVKDKIVALIKDLPDQIEGTPILTRIADLYRAHIA